MRTLPPLGATRRNRSTRALAAGVGLGLLAPLLALDAVAAEAGLTTVTSEGRLLHVVVDHADQDAHEPGGELDIDTFVEVDGTLLQVPAGVPLAESRTGDDVTVTIQAERGLTAAEAVDAASADDGTARVVGVETSPESDPTGPTLQALTTGVRTLTVLPVHFGTPDGATVTSLRTLADTTAQYWSEQSAGRISVASDVRDWKRIPDPGSCSTGDIWHSALTAHGVEAPGELQHVAVYFPRRADCGEWAGMASIGGGIIWINGTQARDVLAHELGHNLGLGHANVATCSTAGIRVALVTPLSTNCTLYPYADRTDVMGFATSMASGNVSTAFADHLGLATVVRPVSGTTTTVDLDPLSRTTGLRAIAVPVAEGTVYIDFRPAAGRDVRAPGWAGVQVRYRTMDPKYGYPTTYLLDAAPETSRPLTAPALAAGRSWAIPGTSQVVTVVSTGDVARVSVGPATPVASDDPLYVPMEPVRLHDARAGVTPGQVKCVLVTGGSGVPAGAAGVALNVTTVQPAGVGHVVVYPHPGTTAASAAPDTSTVNFDPYRDVASAAMVALSDDGRLCYLVRGSRAGIIIDVAGYTMPGSGIELRRPVRLEDQADVAAGVPVTVQVTGHAGVPAGARAVLLNVVAANSDAPGNVRLYRSDAEPPSTSTLNYAVGGDKANAAFVELSTRGELTYLSETAPTNRVRVVLDVVGYTTDGSTYVPVRPVRLVDTRPSDALTAGQRIALPVTDNVGVPAHASAVVLNAVGVGPSTVGNLKVFPFRRGSSSLPAASNLNHIPGSHVANMVVAGIGDDRRVVFSTEQFPGGSTHVVVDVVGYLTNFP